MQESKNEILIKGRIPLVERNSFQTFLMGEMGAKHGDPESQIKWLKYAKLVSDIIDDENNIEIRSSIMSGDNKKAAQLVLDALGIKQEELIHR